MAGETLDLEQIISIDDTAHRLVEKYVSWETARQDKVKDWEEVRRYVYATDTSQTTNAKLPWKNKTTLPKICQIRDNLIANYEAALFPRRNWLLWEGGDESSENKDKKNAITNYMRWVVGRPQFKKMIKKLLYDYIDYGNCFATVEWKDETLQLEDGETKVGYIGPAIVRVNPLNHVFNPTASAYEDAPKFIKTYLTLGEIQKRIKSAEPHVRETMQAVFDYIIQVRGSVRTHPGDVKSLDSYYQMDGFDSFQHYLSSDVAEVLTFYGDFYDVENNELQENRIITVIDRHKVLSNELNPSASGKPPIRHAGWRIRQDNLWAMGPLDNLVGLQYRLDHVENIKADFFDITIAPPLKISGYVEDFDWGPMERIYTGDSGDVELMGPDTTVLQSNIEIAAIEQRMEEMAGSPREAAGFRTPGEKTAFEVQRLENAASRIFQNKITQFEEIFLEPILNDMLEVSRRNIDNFSLRVFNDELQFAKFLTLNSTDITGVGRIVPVAARHFAERANQVQNINEFYTSAAGSDEEIRNHFSSFKMAKVFETLLDLEDFKVVQENVRIGERADAQRQSNSLEEQVQVEQATPSGLSPEDTDEGLDEELAQEFLDE